MNDFTKLTPEQRALLESASIPDLPIGGVPRVILLQVNSPQLLNSPENSFYLHGSMAGGYSLPGNEGAVFQSVPPGFHSGVFALSVDFIELALDEKGNLKQVGEPHAEMPADAGWRFDPLVAKNVCRNSAGNTIQKRIHAFMRIEETGQLGVLTFTKTALRVGNDFANSSQRLQADGLDFVQGVVLGRFAWGSRIKTENGRSWFLPTWRLIGKLGREGGPTLAQVLELAELRKAFRAGLPTMLTPKTPKAVEGPPEPPPEGPPEPPPPPEPDDEGPDESDKGERYENYDF